MLYPVHINLGRWYLAVQHLQRVRLMVVVSALTWVVLLGLGGRLSGADGGYGAVVCVGATVLMNHLVAWCFFASFDTDTRVRFLANAYAVGRKLSPIFFVATLCTLLFKGNGLLGDVSLLPVWVAWVIAVAQITAISVLLRIAPRFAS